MNEEMNNKLIEYLDSLGGVAKAAASFAGDNLPMVIQEFLAWEFYSNIFIVILCILAGILGLCLGQAGLVNHNELVQQDKTTEDPSVVIPIVFGGMLLGVAVGIGSVSAYQAAKVKIAPRIVVLEKISDMIMDIKRQ